MASALRHYGNEISCRVMVPSQSYRASLFPFKCAGHIYFSQQLHIKKLIYIKVSKCLYLFTRI